MRLTTKGRYTIYALYNLSKRSRKKPTPLVELARGQDIPVGFLAALFVQLRRHGIVASVRGPHGGYVLGRDPREITVGEILRAAGEDILPPFCRREYRTGRSTCPRDGECSTHLLWDELRSTVDRFLDSTTLDDIDRLPAGLRRVPDPEPALGTTDQGKAFRRVAATSVASVASVA